MVKILAGTEALGESIKKSPHCFVSIAGFLLF